MTDRLVETVFYKITTPECVDYAKAAPFTEETDDFILLVKDNKAVFQGGYLCPANVERMTESGPICPHGEWRRFAGGPWPALTLTVQSD